MADTGTGQVGSFSTQGRCNRSKTVFTSFNPRSRYFSSSGRRESVEEKICHNLRYNLDQLKISGEREAYMKIVDSLLVGPEIVRKVDNM